MRLIDADAAADEIMHQLVVHTDELGMTAGAIMIAIAKMIRDETIFPTIEAEPVRLAHWIPGKRGKWRCSCCGNEIYCTSADDLQRNHEFCGHCGAEMKDQCDMRTLIEEAIL